jgi:hypothetical protein
LAKGYNKNLTRLGEKYNGEFGSKNTKMKKKLAASLANTL